MHKSKMRVLATFRQLSHGVSDRIGRFDLASHRMMTIKNGNATPFNFYWFCAFIMENIVETRFFADLEPPPAFRQWNFLNSLLITHCVPLSRRRDRSARTPSYRQFAPQGQSNRCR